jgi:hypothetical protein
LYKFFVPEVNGEAVGSKDDQTEGHVRQTIRVKKQLRKKESLIKKLTFNILYRKYVEHKESSGK